MEDCVAPLSMKSFCTQTKSWVYSHCTLLGAVLLELCQWVGGRGELASSPATTSLVLHYIGEARLCRLNNSAKTGGLSKSVYM